MNEYNKYPALLQSLHELENFDWPQKLSSLERFIILISDYCWDLGLNPNVNEGYAKIANIVGCSYEEIENAYIKLNKALNPKPVRREISRELRKKILERDQYTCKKCSKSIYQYPTLKLHIDHIYPISKGGTNDLNNLQVLCKSCNSKKSSKIEIEEEKVKLLNKMIKTILKK